MPIIQDGIRIQDSQIVCAHVSDKPQEFLNPTSGPRTNRLRGRTRRTGCMKILRGHSSTNSHEALLSIAPNKMAANSV